MKIDKSGFGMVAVLLLLVVVGFIGGIGYYVYGKNSSNTATQSSTSENTPSKTNPVSTSSAAKQQTSTTTKTVVPTGSRAKGTLTVANNYTTSYQLPKGTLFKEKATGLIYYSTSAVTAPAVAYATLAPSTTVDVNVEAAETGAKYNSDFTKEGSSSEFNVYTADNTTEVIAGLTGRLSTATIQQGGLQGGK